MNDTTATNRRKQAANARSVPNQSIPEPDIETPPALPKTQANEITNANEITPRRLMDAPKAFTRAAVREYLDGRGMLGIADSFALEQILGTISQRQIRNVTNAGQLEAINPGKPPYIYTIEAVIAFLIANPRYIAQQREMWEVTEDTADHVRAIIGRNWRSLLQFDDVAGLVAEVQYRMMKTPKTPCNEGTVITAILAKIWRKYKSRGLNRTLSLDAINEERTRI